MMFIKRILIHPILLAIILSLNTMCAQNAKEPLTYLALGDSYTIGESVAENERWPVQLAHALTERGTAVAKPQIIAVTGWRTDNLKNGIEIAQLKSTYDMVSLLIGVNNQYQGKSIEEYATEYEELLNMAIKFAGDDRSRVFVVSIPDYGYTPFGEPKKDTISAEIDAFNNVNKEITESYGVSYFNITDISREGLKDPALVADDKLHPSGKQYTMWVERIMEDWKVE
ncbi:MAG: SGNH/GDSL hydrolase family protein [Cyclobacteriaceae bacterium]